MPTPYSPGSGSSMPSALQLARKNSCGICTRMPAPSPVSGSQPQAPRCVEVRRTVEALLDDVVRALAVDVDDEADAAGVVLECADRRVLACWVCHRYALRAVRVPSHDRRARLRSRRRDDGVGGGAARAARARCASRARPSSRSAPTPSIERMRLISRSSDDVFVGLHLEQQRVARRSRGGTRARRRVASTSCSNADRSAAGGSSDTPMKAVMSRPSRRASRIA